MSEAARYEWARGGRLSLGAIGRKALAAVRMQSIGQWETTDRYRPGADTREVQERTDGLGAKLHEGVSQAPGAPPPCR